MQSRVNHVLQSVYLSNFVSYEEGVGEFAPGSQLTSSRI
nr:MAG TPA: hypothetical protein [Podoviridae sp. ctgHy19]